MLRQKFVLSYSSKFGIQAIQLVSNIIVARIAGPTVIGTIAFGLSFVNMFSFIGNLGMGSANVKIINEGHDINKCITAYSIIHISTKLLFLLIVLAYYLIQKHAFNFSFETKNHEYVIFIFLMMAIVQTFVDIPLSTFIAKTAQAKQDISEIMKQSLLQPSRIIAVALGGQAIALALVNFSAIIVMIPVYWYFHREYKFGSLDKDLMKKYLKYALPLITIGITSSFLHTLDKVLLQYFWNSQEVGYYAAAYRISSVFLTMTLAVANIFFPLFAKAFEDKQYGFIEQKIKQFEHLLLVFLLPLMIFIMIYADTIVLLLLGDKFEPSSKILTILILAMFTYMASIPYGNLIIGIGLFKLTAYLNIINVILLCAAMALFVHPTLYNLGGVGTALAILTSYLYLAITFRLVIIKKAPMIHVKWNAEYYLFGIITFLLFRFLLKKTIMTSKLGFHWVQIISAFHLSNQRRILNGYVNSSKNMRWIHLLYLRLKRLKPQLLKTLMQYYKPLMG